MKDKKVDYIAIYGMADSPESPSAIARFIQCKDPFEYKYEMCNPTHPWFESRNNVFKYFKGLETGGYEISDEVANKFLESWKKNWPKSNR